MTYPCDEEESIIFLHSSFKNKKSFIAIVIAATETFKQFSHNHIISFGIF